MIPSALVYKMYARQESQNTPTKTKTPSTPQSKEGQVAQNALNNANTSKPTKREYAYAFEYRSKTNDLIVHTALGPVRVT